MAEKNVTFSLDCDATPGPAEEEMGKKNFTFHIEVPISDEEIERWVISISLLKSQELESLNCNTVLVEKTLLLYFNLLYKTKYTLAPPKLREKLNSDE